MFPPNSVKPSYIILSNTSQTPTQMNNKKYNYYFKKNLVYLKLPCYFKLGEQYFLQYY